MNTNSTTATVAAVALAIIVTPPPAWKTPDGKGKPYWQVELRDQQGNRYSNVYRFTDEDRAKALVNKIAQSRGIPITIKAPYPARPVPPPPAAPVESRDYDNDPLT